MTYNEWNAKEVESGAHPTAWTGWCAGFEEGRHARDEEVKALHDQIENAVLAERKIWQAREGESYRQAMMKRVVEAEARIERVSVALRRLRAEVVGSLGLRPDIAGIWAVIESELMPVGPRRRKGDRK